MLIYDLMPVESYKSIWLRKYRNSLKEKLPAIFLPRYDSVYLVVFHEGPISIASLSSRFVYLSQSF